MQQESFLQERLHAAACCAWCSSVAVDVQHLANLAASTLLSCKPDAPIAGCWFV
jgi:hypothetical protein